MLICKEVVVLGGEWVPKRECKRLHILVTGVSYWSKRSGGDDAGGGKSGSIPFSENVYSPHQKLQLDTGRGHR